MSTRAKIQVWDMAGDGTGPWRILVNGVGTCTLPLGRSASEDPEAYTREVARCIAEGVQGYVGEDYKR